MLTLLANQYPPARNRAATGIIPIEIFNGMEKVFRGIAKEYKLRVYYRGPRIGNATTTKRSDATGVVLYYQEMRKSVGVAKPQAAVATQIMIIVLMALGVITIDYAIKLIM